MITHHHQAPFQPSALPQQPSPTHIPERWHWLIRLGWATLLALLIGLCLESLPEISRTLATPCSGVACTQGYQQLSASDAQKLASLGLTLDRYANYWIVLDSIVVVLWMAIAILVFWRKSDDWVAILVASMFLLVGISYLTDNVLYSVSPWSIPENFLYQAKSLALLLTLALFPNSRPVPRWSVWVAFVYPAYAVVYLVFLQQIHHPNWSLNRNPLNASAWFGCSMTLAILQIYRYFRVSTPGERLQTKWVAYSLLLVLSGGFISTATQHLTSFGQIGIGYFLLQNFTILGELLIPISFAFAILRYRLWDIDVIINRTLVYVALTAGIIGLYILVVGYLGALFHTGTNPLISLIATGLVAVLFQPGREWLQRGVNRLMYGQRDEPYRVISRLGLRLEATLAPDAVLPAIAETVAQALNLPYAAILLHRGDTTITAAAYGTPGAYHTKLPLVYQTEPIGEFLLAPRSPGEDFSPADHALLSDLARQAGIAAHAIQLTADLHQLAEQLQASRLQIITALEEERRRLRRDLHDGLGSALTSVTFQLDAATNLLDRDPQAVKTLLQELKDQMQTSIADIRRLVYNLRPPILDEWGLVAAVREQVAQYQLHQVQVTVDAPDTLPPLPAALEVAAYRIALEALANVVRHAHATQCTIQFERAGEALIVEVRDNGKGLPDDYHAGVGINAMRERAAELGGTFRIERHAGWGGARVIASLPLAKE